nr:hypothetical protein [Paenibacillus sp. A9]
MKETIEGGSWLISKIEKSHADDVIGATPKLTRPTAGDNMGSMLSKGKGNTLKNFNGLDDILNDPSKLKGVKPEELYKHLKDNGYNPTPLNKIRNYSGVPFEEGGGFKVNWGGDRILQYHPGSSYDGDVPYYKISSGSTGTQRFNMDGNFIK